MKRKGRKTSTSANSSKVIRRRLILAWKPSPWCTLVLFSPRITATGVCDGAQRRTRRQCGRTIYSLGSIYNKQLSRGSPMHWKNHLSSFFPFNWITHSLHSFAFFGTTENTETTFSPNLEMLAYLSRSHWSPNRKPWERNGKKPWNWTILFLEPSQQSLDRRDVHFVCRTAKKTGRRNKKTKSKENFKRWNDSSSSHHMQKEKLFVEKNGVYLQ